MKTYGYTKKTILKLTKIISLFTFAVILGLSIFKTYTHFHQQQTDYQILVNVHHQTLQQLTETSQRLTSLESEDQYQKNQQLQANLAETKQVFNQSIVVYEKLVDLNKPNLQKDFAHILNQLSDLNYATAATLLTKLDTDIDQAIIAAQATKGIDIASLTLSNSPPPSGYQRQKVNVDGVDYVVDIVAGDLTSTRVVVDTASNADCRDNCPVLSLASYAARNGAFAAINGSYFCPASYPSCAGKTNSFDLLVMNKNKTYFNSDNNVYSNNPAVIFSGSSVRFVGRASEWGRDTGVDGVISNFPLLLINGQIQFGGDEDPKKSSVGSRPFVAAKGSIVYIGVVRGVTVAQGAKVLQALGMEHAMNLDSGGSTAMWVNGSYKAGPGRDIPNAILLIRK